MAKKPVGMKTRRKAKKKKSVAAQKAKDKNSSYRNKHGKRDKLKTKKIITPKKRGKLRRASSKSKADAPSARENLRRNAEHSALATESIADAVAEGIAEVQSDVTGPVPLSGEEVGIEEERITEESHFDGDETDEDFVDEDDDSEGYF